MGQSTGTMIPSPSRDKVMGTRPCKNNCQSPHQAIRVGDLACYQRMATSEDELALTLEIDYSIREGRLEFIQFFVDQNYRFPPDAHTIAASKGYVEILTLLVQKVPMMEYSKTVEKAIFHNQTACLALLLPQATPRQKTHFRRYAEEINQPDCLLLLR